MKKLIIPSLAVILFTGCIAQQVPRFGLSVDMKKGTMTLDNPKDTTVSKFKSVIGTNGLVSVEFDSLTTVMNPNVITTTGDAQAKMITAVAQGVADGISKAK